MKKTNEKLTSFSAHLDKQYGKKGTAERDKYEEGFEAFQLGVMIQERFQAQVTATPKFAPMDEPTFVQM